MPDENQDQPVIEKIPSVSEPERPKPPWQTEEETEPKEEAGPQPTAGFKLSPAEITLQGKPQTEKAPVGISPSETPPSEESSELPPSQPPEPARAFHAESKPFLNIMKKILPIILGLIVVAGLVFFLIKVALPRFQKPEEATLTYWGLWEPDSVMRQLITDWNEDHSHVKINYSMQSKEQYRERLQSALARGQGPDIFRYHITWTPMFKSQLDSIPTAVMSSSQFDTTFYPVASANLRSGTNYLGIPLEVDTLALFYNKNIFQTAGKTPPATWDELRRVAIELTTYDEAGRIQTAGVALGTTNNIEHWSDILGLMMLQNEADLANPTDSLAEDALIFYTIFNKTDQVWDLTLPNSTLAFANGKLAMYFGYSWDVFEIKNINPNLEFGVVKAPQLSGTNISWASFWVEGVNNKSEHKNEAWEFLQYLSSKEILAKLYQAESQLRLFGEPYSRIDMASQAKTNPLVSSFIDQAPQAQTWYLCSRTFDNGINDKMIGYFKDAVNAVNINKTPAEALETAAYGVAQLLSQYGLAGPIVR
mgnify:CR=1 FL=1